MCGINATCVVQTGPNGADTRLLVTMTGDPSIVAAGSTAGAQFPVVVTDSAFIFNNSTGPWYLPGSADRVFGPLGN